MKEFFTLRFVVEKKGNNGKAGRDFWVFIYWNINVINIADLFYFLMEVKDFQLYTAGPTNGI